MNNRIYHRSIEKIPNQELIGLKADVSKQNIFGSRVYARIPGADKFPKLDHKNTHGISLNLWQLTIMFTLPMLYLMELT